VKNAQEAHEAVRPAGDRFRTPDDVARELSGDEFRLYDLIWKRTVASQMADARGQTVSVRIAADADDGRAVEFSTAGTVITFRGFLLAYEEGRDDAGDDAEEKRLPNLTAGDTLAATELEPDLAVLDVMLPSGDGFELARALRDARDLPIVFLTARDAVEDRLRGFGLGADDYLVKPFRLEELLARVRAVLRRTGPIGAAIEAGDVVIDEQAGLAARAGTRLELTATELRLLAYLVRQRGLLLSKHQLLTQVWGYDAYDPNVVEVHVSALRRKLEAHGPRILHTVRGLGYRLDTR